MLIPFSECVQILKSNNINITGILHIGAHMCEELNDYKNENIKEENIYWIDAIPEMVNHNLSKGIKNVYNYAIDNEEGEAIFNISNNGQSSSLLNFGTHKSSYPWCHFISTIKVNKKKISSFFEEHPEIDSSKLNFWNLDIQGVELNALKSAGDFLNNVQAIYSEINIEYVYENCGILLEMNAFLESKGFKLIKKVLTKEGWGDALWLKK